MTILNKKSAPTKFNQDRHYHPNSPFLKGINFKVNREKSEQRIIKDLAPIEVLACPEQDGNIYLSRLKSDPNTCEWVQG